MKLKKVAGPILAISLAALFVAPLVAQEPAAPGTEKAEKKETTAGKTDPAAAQPDSHSGDPAPEAGQSSGAGQGVAVPPAPQPAGNDSQELAKKLANPVASMISVPFQNNFDFGLGANKDGFRYTMNFQPVIPVRLNKDWNLILRTIVPIIHQSDVVPGTSQSDLGDIVQSFFFSPNKTKPFVWAVGPVLLYPSGTDRLLGTGKFGAGPTFLILKQKKQWTVGTLMNHIWSVAGDSARSDVSSTFVQPFISYTTRTAWTFSINTESTYDWVSKQWSVPVNISVSKLVRFGRQPVSFGGGPKCWATSPAGGAQSCGLRFTVTPLFPKK